MNLSPDPWVWIGVFLTLCVFSFLYRDNPLYRFAEHLMVGVANGYSISFTYHRVIVPYLVEPLTKAVKTTSSQGFSSDLLSMGDSPAGSFLVIIPALIGMMYFTRFIPKYGWMVRFPIGIFMGYYTGYQVPTIFEGTLFPQLRDTLLTQADFQEPMKAIGAVLLILGVIGTLTYFFFSKEHKGVIKVGAKTGIIFVMIGFGASFGFTVMARISLAIGRFYFLLRDWLGIAG